MTTRAATHLCPDCALCVCGCNDCGRATCACLDCPCENSREHGLTPCEHTAAATPAPLTAQEADTALQDWYRRNQYKQLPALTPHTRAPRVSRYPHHAHPPVFAWSPTAYAGLKGLTGAAADMFAEIAGIIQNARETTPW